MRNVEFGYLSEKGVNFREWILGGGNGINY